MILFWNLAKIRYLRRKYKVAAYHLKPPLWCLNIVSRLAAHKVSEQLRSAYIWKVKTTHLASLNLHFYFNFGKSMLHLNVIYYVRSIISFSRFLGRTPRCVPRPGAKRACRQGWLITSHSPQHSSLACPAVFSAPWTGLPLGKTEITEAH